MSNAPSDAIERDCRAWLERAAEFVPWFERWARAHERPWELRGWTETVYDDGREEVGAVFHPGLEGELPVMSQRCHQLRRDWEVLFGKLVARFGSVPSLQPVFDFLSVLDDNFVNPPAFRDVFPVGGSYSLAVAELKARSASLDAHEEKKA
jgi:hypothetical protein